MQEVIAYTPVVLDPNSAHAKLSVSGDLTSVVGVQDPQLVPCNPDRFLHMVGVLGSEGFSEGTHYWDVSVRDAQRWCLGVVQESHLGFACPNFAHGGLWYIREDDEGFYPSCATPGQEVVRRVNEKLNCIRVLLDQDRGRLTFSDPERKIHLRTFKHRFSGVMFPFFSGLSELSRLQVLPVGTTVAVAVQTQKRSSGKAEDTDSAAEMSLGLLHT
ncbi:erythroid membrane-associated protein-like [Alosa pseudoharengus]|uniref:erythroid membrane-associated protein-like n=1 Tax=Alosa pseudoharengus TaxID=34774 RepID=UPI003F8A0883